MHTSPPLTPDMLLLRWAPCDVGSLLSLWRVVLGRGVVEGNGGLERGRGFVEGYGALDRMRVGGKCPEGIRQLRPAPRGLWLAGTKCVVNSLQPSAFPPALCSLLAPAQWIRPSPSPKGGRTRSV